MSVILGSNWSVSSWVVFSRAGALSSNSYLPRTSCYIYFSNAAILRETFQPVPQSRGFTWAEVNRQNIMCERCCKFPHLVNGNFRGPRPVYLFPLY